MSDGATETQLEQARQALDDAIGARDAGLSDAVVVNRCYYACFHEAQAVLYDRGEEPTSHGAVLSLYGSEVVTSGDAPRSSGRFLNDLSTLRKQADYGYEPLDEDVDELISRTETFVARAARLVGGK
jgi:uncharacterized protein (UPF0332 family)